MVTMTGVVVVALTVMKRNDGENGDELATKSGRLWGAISRQTVAGV